MGQVRIDSVLDQAPQVIDKEAKNDAVSLALQDYRLQSTKLGEVAPDGSVFLIVRGTLGNNSDAKGTSVPDLQKAFYLTLNGGNIYADPLSEDTADPFWGPVVLEPGEQYPVEMVFVVPDSNIDQMSLRHLSTKGPINLAIIGTASSSVVRYLAGPFSKDQIELSVKSIAYSSNHQGQRAPVGWHYLRVNYWFTNLREMQSLDTAIHELSALVEDGLYVYEPVFHTVTGRRFEQNFFPGERTPGELYFLVPKESRFLELVHFTSEGAIRLVLTPQKNPAVQPEPIAGPNTRGNIVIEVLGIRPMSSQNGLIFDLALGLGLADSMAFLEIDLASSFELHDRRGRIYKSTTDIRELTRALGPKVLRHDQFSRGEVAFIGVPRSNDLVLVLPLVSGHANIDLSASLISKALSHQNRPSNARSLPINKRPSPTETTSRKAPTVTAPPEPKVIVQDPKQITGIPDVLDTGTLSIKGRIVKLYGVRGAHEPHTSQLAGYIRDREVKCTLLDKVYYRCMLGTTDLSEAALLNGAAWILVDAPDHLKLAAEKAKNKQVGVWAR